MALYMPKTTVERVIPRAQLPGGTIAAEGAFLISQQANGVEGVTQSTGASTDVFAGIAIFERTPPTELPRNETLNSGSGTTITLARTPVGGTSAIRVYDLNTSTVLTAGSGADKYALSGAVITLDAGNVGHNIQVVYRYAPTVAEAISLFGYCRQAGGIPTADFYDVVGVASQGDFWTTEFDPTVDWSAANLVLRLGANGRVTVGGSGPIIPGYVISAPTNGTEMPGLSFIGISLR